MGLLLQGEPLLSSNSRAVIDLTPHRHSLTFLGLGRIAPDDVHTAVRHGVTALPGPLEEEDRVVRRTVVKADSLARRPRADAMFTTGAAAAMRKTVGSSFFGTWTCNSASLRYCNNTPVSLLNNNNSN